MCEMQHSPLNSSGRRHAPARSAITRAAMSGGATGDRSRQLSASETGSSPQSFVIRSFSPWQSATKRGWSVMRTFHVRSILSSVFVVLLFTGNPAAQDKSSALLTVPEVQQLVSRAQPGDHARLAAHFTALADRYAADAKRHTTMAASFGGNPNRNMGTGMSEHCKRLTSLNNQSATTARELAAYHQKLAAGTAATPPAGGSRLESGAGARTPTDKDLSALAAQAKTPADHRALEEYFVALSKRYTAEAKEHTTMAQAYRGLTRQTGASSAAVHCDSLARSSTDAAREATAAADMHKQLATVGR
jgi:hypothetical protein